MDINVFISTRVYTIRADFCVHSGFHLGLCYVKLTSSLPRTTCSGFHKRAGVTAWWALGAAVGAGARGPLGGGRAGGCSLHRTPCSRGPRAANLSPRCHGGCATVHTRARAGKVVAACRSPSFTSFSKGGNWSQVKLSISQRTDYSAVLTFRCVISLTFLLWAENILWNSHIFLQSLFCLLFTLKLVL